MAATAQSNREGDLGFAERAAGPCVFVLFGAAGDLTKRKLVPALFNLGKAKLLPDNFAVIGVSVDDLSLDDFRSQVTSFLPAGPDSAETLEWFRKRLFYERGDFADANTFAKLRERLNAIDAEQHTEGNYLFYLATAPKFFSQIVQQLGAAALSRQENGRWRRVVIEKPFGHDLDSAQSLNREIKNVLQENQIYRIDHYLGKETVQNIMVFRFDNAIFEPIWNRRYIDHVQITNAETVGVERRGGYFDTAGTLRDMVPNHVMQLLSLTAMESPVSFQADAVRNEQAKVLHSIQAAGIGRRFAAQRTRTIWTGIVGRGKSIRVSSGARGLCGIAHRDVRGLEAQYRQLALGGGAVLFPDRQTPGAAAHRDRDSVQAHAL